MAKQDFTIHIATPSALIRRGLATLFRQKGKNLKIQEIAEKDLSRCSLFAVPCDILLLDVSFVPEIHHGDLRSYFPSLSETTKVCGIVTTLKNHNHDNLYQKTFSIYQEPNEIWEIVESLFENDEEEIQKGATGELSDREKEVLVQIVKGLTNKEIGEKLNLSIHTVISHRKNITRKLDIKSSSGLTIYAIMNNLISLNEVKEK